MKQLSLVLLLFMVWSCKSDDSNQTNTQNPTIMGLNYSESKNTSSETYANIISALEENANIGIVANINHAANAANNGLTLRDTRVVLFGNPNLGTPLMQENQQAGLDLPQKLAVYEAENGQSFVIYNSTDYLAARHGLEAATLPTIANALKNLATNASGNEIVASSSEAVTLNEGIESITSTQDFTATHTALVEAIEANSNLILVAQLDHQANAQRVGLDLNPTRLVIFGNPNLGTPLMQASQTTAIDLPQKMLVWQDDQGAVHISYNSPDYLAKRHKIVGADTQLQTIGGALLNLATLAAGK